MENVERNFRRRSSSGELLTDNYEANNEYVRIRKILIAMNKQINNVSATNRMVEDMVNEAINFLEKEFNPKGQNIVINIIFMS